MLWVGKHWDQKINCFRSSHLPAWWIRCAPLCHVSSWTDTLWVPLRRSHCGGETTWSWATWRTQCGGLLKCSAGTMRWRSWWGVRKHWWVPPQALGLWKFCVVFFIKHMVPFCEFKRESREQSRKSSGDIHINTSQWRYFRVLHWVSIALLQHSKSVQQN